MPLRSSSVLFKAVQVQENINFFCGRNLALPPLMFTGSGIKITLHTGFQVGTGKGFVIDYLVGEL